VHPREHQPSAPPAGYHLHPTTARHRWCGGRRHARRTCGRNFKRQAGFRAEGRKQGGGIGFRGGVGSGGAFKGRGRRPGVNGGVGAVVPFSPACARLGRGPCRREVDDAGGDLATARWPLRGRVRVAWIFFFSGSFSKTVSAGFHVHAREVCLQQCGKAALKHYSHLPFSASYAHFCIVSIPSHPGVGPTAFAHPLP
jgi:hypothetical protein